MDTPGYTMNYILKLFAISLSLVAAVYSFIERPEHVSQELYSELVFYFKYASSAYAAVCPLPNGQVLVEVFKGLVTDTQGFIARDDTRKEIVIALRGSLSTIDVIIDVGVVLLPFVSPGVDAPDGTLVHSGFLTAWNSVSLTVLQGVRSQLRKYPDYSMVTSGHSLGGALSSLAAMTLKANFPSSHVRMYTFGQPRTGNAIYACWVNDILGDEAFRAVHTYDGVPTMIPAGQPGFLRQSQIDPSHLNSERWYHHHGIEYWQNPDPPSEITTIRCSAEGEDPDCSSSIPTTGVNPAHWSYFGILAVRPFCL